jgi:hypothetical protein
MREIELDKTKTCLFKTGRYQVKVCPIFKPVKTVCINHDWLWLFFCIENIKQDWFSCGASKKDIFLLHRNREVNGKKKKNVRFAPPKNQTGATESINCLGKIMPCLLIEIKFQPQITKAPLKAFAKVLTAE